MSIYLTKILRLFAINKRGVSTILSVLREKLSRPFKHSFNYMQSIYEMKESN